MTGVANKVVGGKKFTILWDVGNLNISHESPDIVTDYIEHSQEIYGTTKAPLTVHWGKKHGYLGMILDYIVEGKVKINMCEYLNKILDDLPEFFDGLAASPAASHLFDINENATKLHKELGAMFHHVVLQLLCKHGRPNIKLGCFCKKENIFVT